jgi:hypothetical protein
MFIIWCKILMTVKSFFVKRPTKKLIWSCENYVWAKKWAKTQPHPFKKNQTLWEFVYDKYESTYTIDNLNKFLFNEI